MVLPSICSWTVFKHGLLKKSAPARQNPRGHGREPNGLLFPIHSIFALGNFLRIKSASSAFTYLKALQPTRGLRAEQRPQRQVPAILEPPRMMASKCTRHRKDFSSSRTKLVSKKVRRDLRCLSPALVGFGTGFQIENAQVRQSTNNRRKPLRVGLQAISSTTSFSTSLCLYNTPA